MSALKQFFSCSSYFCYHIQCVTSSRVVVLRTKHQFKKKISFYIAQYPVRWTAQSALHVLPPLADLFIPTPTRLLREAF